MIDPALAEDVRLYAALLAADDVLPSRRPLVTPDPDTEALTVLISASLVDLVADLAARFPDHYRTLPIPYTSGTSAPYRDTYPPWSEPVPPYTPHPAP